MCFLVATQKKIYKVLGLWWEIKKNLMSMCFFIGFCTHTSYSHSATSPQKITMIRDLPLAAGK